jgi:flagellar assembly protein FliH
MLSSDALREHVATLGRAQAARAAPRAGSRIIAAERLDRFTPFAMHELSGGREDTSDEDAAVAGAPAADEARGARSDPFERFAADAASHPLERDGFEAGYRAGHDAGYAGGLERGYEAATEHARRQQRLADEQAGATLGQRIESLSGALADRFAELERDAAEQVVALALEVARHALRATLAVRPESIVPVVQEALSSLLDERVRMHLHLNPRDAELVRDELGERLAARNCEIVADPTIEAGGCRIETPRAEIDATVATRWRRTLAAIGRESDDDPTGAKR